MRDVTSALITMTLAVPVMFSSAVLAQAEPSQEQLIETRHLDLRLERVVQDLEQPWSVAIVGDGFLISERAGRLVWVDADGQKHTLEGMPEVSARGQGGLLDISLHPRFGDGESHDWLYFTWSKPEQDGTLTALSRVRVETETATAGSNSSLTLGEPELLFRQNRASSPTHHYGSRLAWLPDETLLMTIGDRGDPPRAQDLGDHAGSVLRLTATSGIPDDNPFVDDADTEDALFTAGNRNIQGLAVDADGRAWASEHGPLTGDELNLLQPGENYGWPEVSQGLDYSTREPVGVDSLPGMRGAVYVYEGRFAPSGLAAVTSDLFPAWENNLLAGGLSSEQLVRLVIEDDDVARTEMILDGEAGRIRDVRQGPDGAIYLLEDADSGSLYRLVPAQ
ncbi:PQQ-dependent sugar dehydrogenase [Halomonas sp. Bachu 37]|uniref:PQQ-dependent sugar dehydrogenase n=1 Tax=Halomonas kashgarensis TaxID=3084920 RepID=UPI003217575A